MWMAIAPEGTRSLTPHWKSGFHRLALAADVPVGLAFIDWSRREVGISGYVRMTGDREADMARIGAAYAGKVGLRPENAGPIRLGDDDR
jgi:hypothetical protein